MRRRCCPASICPPWARCGTRRPARRRCCLTSPGGWRLRTGTPTGPRRRSAPRSPLPSPSTRSRAPAAASRQVLDRFNPLLSRGGMVGANPQRARRTLFKCAPPAARDRRPTFSPLRLAAGDHPRCGRRQAARAPTSTLSSRWRRKAALYLASGGMTGAMFRADVAASARHKPRLVRRAADRGRRADPHRRRRRLSGDRLR